MRTHPSFFIQTFGCKSNQYESQALRESLVAAGFAETDLLEAADLYLLNTCAVTGRAAASCRRALRRASKANPSLRLVVTGCGVDLGDAWEAASDSGPPLQLKNAQKPLLAKLAKEWLAGEPALPPPAPGDAGAGDWLGVSGFAGHSRAFLKIQDGCGNGCAYCAVPLARGGPASRPVEEILAEAERLTAAGFGELVLTGINIGDYRFGDLDFAGLVEKTAAARGLARLRLGSVEPPRVTAGLAEVMRGNPGICPHIHMPLQSGDDRVLTAMGRRYTVDEYLAKADLLRERLEFPALGSDVMLGFPGEDAAAFQNTLAVCRRVGFSRLHVFPFSPRPGTRAAAWRRDLPKRVGEERKEELLQLGREMAAAFASRCLGREERVAVERDGGLSDRYLRVRPERPDAWKAAPGAVIRVRITAAEGAELRGARL